MVLIIFSKSHTDIKYLVLRNTLSLQSILENFKKNQNLQKNIGLTLTLILGKYADIGLSYDAKVF